MKDKTLRSIISQGDTSKAYRDFFKQIVRIHREYFTEENIPTAKSYLQELLDDAFEEASFNERVNFLGMPAHPSDQLLHLRDKQSNAQNIRDAWDEVPEELMLHVKTLMEKAHDLTHREEAEGSVGKSL